MRACVRVCVLCACACARARARVCMSVFTVARVPMKCSHIPRPTSIAYTVRISTVHPHAYALAAPVNKNFGMGPF